MMNWYFIDANQQSTSAYDVTQLICLGRRLALIHCFLPHTGEDTGSSGQFDGKENEQKLIWKQENSGKDSLICGADMPQDLVYFHLYSPYIQWWLNILCIWGLFL